MRDAPCALADAARADKLGEERALHPLEKATPPNEITEDSLYDSDGIEVETDDESEVSGDYYHVDYDHHVEYALDSLWENTMPCWRQPRHVFKMSVAA